jgi:hypothetical protein
MVEEVGEASALVGMVALVQGRWKDVFRVEFIDAVQRSGEVAASVFDTHLCFAEYRLYGLSTRREIEAYGTGLLDIARRSGSVHGQALAQLLLGEAELLSGRFEAAQRHLTRSDELHGQAGAAAGRAPVMRHLADVAVAWGDARRARRLLKNGLQLATASPMAAHVVVKIHEGLVRVASGRGE